MLKRVPPDQLRLGMYIGKFEGDWFAHPFWRARFVIDNSAVLEKIQTSGIAAAWIDESKGSALSQAPVPVSLPPSLSSNALAPADRVKAAKRDSMTWWPIRPDAEKEDRAAARQTVQQAKAVMKSVLDGARVGKTIRSADVLRVVDDISAALVRNAAMFLGITRLKTRHEYTYLHSVAVCALMINLGRELELDDAQVHEAGIAGLLHDVGKMAVPEAILNKPGALTADEFAQMRDHTTRGHAMLQQDSAIPQAARDVCLNHHEKIDGTGYPLGLTGDKISLHARMGAICDVYDAMTSQRCYKDAFTPMDAIVTMHADTGHFDPELLFRFMRSIGLYPPGLLVRLRSNQLALVLPAKGRRHRPQVRAFYAITDRCFIDPVDISISGTLAGDQIMREEDPADWNLSGWPVLRDTILDGAQPLDSDDGEAALVAI